MLLHKPYAVICQFTPDGRRPTLAQFVDRRGVYPVGRLDAESEGLVVLTDDGDLQARIADPRHGVTKTYWAQVEGVATTDQVASLRRGVALRDFTTAPARVQVIAQPPMLAPRDPPIRVRSAIPTTWLAITIGEGRNRQVRRMTAAVGLPTLRLIRYRVASWTIDGLAPGETRILHADAW